MARYWKKASLAAIVILTLIVAYDRVVRMRWVGHTDLEVEFVITDATTGSPIPIPNATIDVVNEDLREAPPAQFILVTDQDGSVHRDGGHRMCSGEISGLKFTNTYYVGLPYWRFRVLADGYQTTEMLELSDWRRQTTKLVGSQKSKLVVPISLAKKE